MPVRPHPPKKNFRHSVLLAVGLAAACTADPSTGPVPQDRISAVVLTAPSQYLAPGDTVRFTVQVMDSNGRVLPDEPVTWTSSTPSVARVNGEGLVTADSVGATTITATAGGKHGTADLAVQVFELCDCTRILDSTAMTLVSRDDSTGRYVFRVVRGPAPSIVPGDIVVGAQGVGYIRRVEQSSLVGDVLTLETAQAYVEEAVRDGGFATTAYTDDPSGAPAPGRGAWVGPWTTTYMAPGVRLNRAGLCCTMDGLSIGIKIAQGPVAGSVDFTVKQGGIEFSPRADIGARVSWFQLKEFHSIFQGNLGLDLQEYELKVALTGSTNVTEKLSKESKSFLIQQRPYATFIGPMPVLIIFTKKLSLEITPTVSASVTFTGKYHSGIALSAGVRWADGGGWTPVSSATPYDTAIAPQFQGVEGSASVKIAVVPEYNMLIYGAVGPFVNLEPFAEPAASAGFTFANGSATGLNWATKVAIGLNLNMGAKLSVFGRKDLFQVGFAIPLVKPLDLIRDFSDGPLTVRAEAIGQDLPASLGVRLRPAFTDKLPLTGRRDLSTSTRDTLVAANDSVTLDRIRSGTGFPHQLTLTNIPGNCYDSLANPDTVSIRSAAFVALGNASTAARFLVNCIPLGGVRVAAVTTGPDAPSRYAVTLLRRDTVGVGRATTAETVSVSGGLAASDTILEDFVPRNTRRGGTGRLDATLNPGRRNCAVALPTTHQLVVQSGDTVSSQFLVTCVPLGLVRLQTTTVDADAGPTSDPVEFVSSLTPQAPVDTVATPPGPLAANGSELVSGLVPLYNASGAPGRYTAGLGDAPNRCTEPGTFTRTVTVFPGDTATASFLVACVERLHVVTQTTGPGTDPDGYRIVVENDDGSADTVGTAITSAVGIAGVVPGAHVVRLAGVESSCVAPAPANVVVDGRDSTRVTFHVSCPAPPQPTGLVATLIDSNRIDLGWTPVPPATPVALYRVYRAGVLHDSTVAAAYSDPGLPPHTTFVYQVSAVSPTGLEGAKSAPLSVRTLDGTPPTAPAGLVASAVSGARINLSWQSATDPETGVAGYQVFRDGAEIASSTTTAYADTGLASTTTYTYQVRAVNGDGLQGPLSAPATATTLDGTPPTAPTGLAATPVSGTAIGLAWSPAADAESGIDGYNLYRDGVLVTSVPSTTFTDTGLFPSTSYTYTVSATNGAGMEGPMSQPSTAMTLPDQTPPTAPSGLSALAVSSSRIDLAWVAAGDAESGIQAYRVYRDGVLAWTGSGTEYSDLGLSPSTSYTYRVTAVNGAGLEGPASTPVTATTPGASTGDLLILTVSTGSHIPSEYEAKLLDTHGNILQRVPIEANGSVLFASLAPQGYKAWLYSVPSKCTVAGANPRPVTVVAGAVTSTTFTVTCR